MNRHARHMLFLFSDTGGGHRSSAEAVAEAVQDRYGASAQIEMVDVLADYAPWPFSHAGTVYPYMVRLRGLPWAVGYRLSDGPRRVRLFVRSCWPLAHMTLLHLFSNHSADVIVSFHPAYNHAITRAMAETRTKTNLLTMVTDLATAHSFWIAPEIPYCLVPTEAVRQRALDCGLPAERIQVTGLPVSPRFVRTAREDAVEVRRRLGLEPDLPTVLLVSGAEGMGPVHRLCRVVIDSGVQAQMVIITGRNERLRSRLSAEVWPLPVRVEGFVRNMHEWMRAADLLVTKAGPSTVSEALVMGLPMVLSGALPGQERPTVDYVVRAGAGVWAPTAAQVTRAICRLLAADNMELAQMSARARAIARPNAAWRAADIIWKAAGGELPIRPGATRLPVSAPVLHQ
jgi:1,2-diacylglycerol 3-beta-galactosyltransferase